MSLSNSLKEIANQKKIKYKSIAEKMSNTSPDKVSRILNGKTKLSISDFIEICKILKIDPNMFYVEKLSK